jgi:hypothetical protein
LLVLAPLLTARRPPPRTPQDFDVDNDAAWPVGDRWLLLPGWALKKLPRYTVDKGRMHMRGKREPGARAGACRRVSPTRAVADRSR